MIAIDNLPSGNILGILAVAGTLTISDLEDGSDGASVLAGHSLQADVVLAAVIGMGVTGEGASVGDLSGSGATESSGDLLVAALGHLVGPHADACLTVVGESGGALVARGLSVPAVPEDVALGLIGKDSVQAGAVGGADWGLCGRHKQWVSKLTKG